MTRRHNGYIVILKEDIREDDAESIINALKMINGVLDVQPIVASFEIAIAEARIRRELIEKLFNILKGAP